MKIIFEKPVALTATGKRQTNEDSLYPIPSEANATDRLFIVCDGVGGHQKGDVASKLACQGLVDFFTAYPKHLVNKEFMRRAFTHTEEYFDKYLAQNKEAKGMATTAVVLYVEGSQIIAAHCGDSRLYHIRKGICIFKTEDHTPINDMLRQSIITLEEALQEKRSSQISRAIQGASVKATMPEINILPAIEKQDVFLLCTDGIWDSEFEQNVLENILATHEPLEAIMAKIQTQCENHSKDNFTAYLLRVQRIENTEILEPIEGVLVETTEDIDDSRTTREIGLILDDPKEDFKENHKENPKEKPKQVIQNNLNFPISPKHLAIIATGTVFLIILIFLLAWLFTSEITIKKEPKKPKEKTITLQNTKSKLFKKQKINNTPSQLLTIYFLGRNFPLSCKHSAAAWQWQGVCASLRSSSHPTTATQRHYRSASIGRAPFGNFYFFKQQKKFLFNYNSLSI